jgi:hypothetical protein
MASLPIRPVVLCTGALQVRWASLSSCVHFASTSIEKRSRRASAPILETAYLQAILTLRVPSPTPGFRFTRERSQVRNPPRPLRFWRSAVRLDRPVCLYMPCQPVYIAGKGIGQLLGSEFFLGGV